MSQPFPRWYCQACGSQKAPYAFSSKCPDCGTSRAGEPPVLHADNVGEPFARSYDCEIAEPLRGSVTLDALVTVSDASRIAAECRTAAIVTGEVTFFLVNGVLRVTIDNYTVFG